MGVIYPSPVLSNFKTFMWFCPEIILSNCWRQNCICNIKKLPSIDIRGGPPYHTDTLLVPVCVVNREVSLLYIKRFDVMPFCGTKVTFPGSGKVHRDETVYEAVAHHTHRDIGICDIKFWTTMGQVLSRGPNVAVTPVIGELNNFHMTKVRTDPATISDVFTVPLRVLCDPNCHAYCKHNGVIVPVFAGGKHYIWGITAMITHRFLYALLSREIYNPYFCRYELRFRLMKS